MDMTENEALARAEAQCELEVAEDLDAMLKSVRALRKSMNMAMNAARTLVEHDPDGQVHDWLALFQDLQAMMPEARNRAELFDILAR